MNLRAGRGLFGLVCHLLAATALTAPALAQNPTKTTNRWGAHADVVGEASTLDSSGGISFFVPVLQNQNALLFVDANLNSGFDSSVYGSFAAGYRQIMGNGTILGGFVSFDALTQDGRQYTAVGFGAEILGDRLEARMNAQIPISSSYQLPVPGAVTAGSTLSLVDNSLIESITTGVQTRHEVPQTRIEGEVGVKVPLDFSGDNGELKVFGGGYYLHGSGQDDLFGVSARLEYAVREPFGDSLPGSKLFLGATAKYDRENKFDLGAQVRLSIPLGAAAGSADPGVDDRMTHHLVRSNRIATRVRSINTLSTTERVAVNPDGDEYNSIYFADGADTLGAGTQADPTTLADAVTQAGTDGIIVAEGNNGIINTGGVTLQNGQQLLGGGTGVPVRLDDNSIVTFTLGTTAGQIQGVPAANIINLGLDNTLRNFSLDSGLAGIAGGAVGTLVLDNLTIANTAGAGMAFTGASGTVTGTDITITGAGGAGIKIDGGSAVFDIAGVINHNAAGATGAAVEIDGSSGNVTISSAITNTSGAHLIDIGGSSAVTGGAILFSGTTSDTSGLGIRVQNLGAGASFSLTGTTTLTTPTATGIFLSSNAGAVSFADVAISNPGTAGIDIEGTSAGQVTFGNVDITDLAAGKTGLDLTGADVAATFTTLDISGTGGTGIDLTGSTNTQNVGTTDSSMIVGLDIGVDLTNASITGLFQYGDGEGTIDVASTIDAGFPIVIAGLNGATGTYNFRDVALVGDITQLQTNKTVYFVDATTNGAGTINDPGTIEGAEASGADVIILLDTQIGAAADIIDIASVAQQPGGFVDGTLTLATNQQLMGFGAGDTIDLGGGAPANVLLTGVSSTITNPFAGSGSAILTTTTAATSTVTLSDNNLISGVTIENGGAGGVAAISGTGITSLTIEATTIQNSTGGGILINGASGTIAISDTAISGTGSTGLGLTGVTGTVNITNSSVSNSAAGGVAIDGGAGAMTLGIDVSGIDGTALSIINRTGGTINFGGMITETDGTGSGVSITGNSGGSTSFSAMVAASTGTDNAVFLQNNAGYTVNFNGGLDLDTTTGDGLTATNGGTLNIAVTAGNETVDTAGGRAVYIGTGAGIVTTTGISLDTVTASAVATLSGIEVDSLSGAGAFSVGAATISGVETSGILLTDITTTGAFSIGSINISGISGAGIQSGGGHTATLNLGNGAGGVSVDGTQNGASFSGTHAIVNLGTGAGGLQLGVNAVINGDGLLFAPDSTGTFNIGTAGTASRILVTGGSATADGVHYQNSDATVTATNLQIEQAGGHGLFIEDDDAIGQFTLAGTSTIDAVNLDGIRIAGANASISGVTIGAGSAPVGNGVTVTDSGQAIVVALNSITATSVGGTGISLDGTGGGSLTVTSFANNTVTRALAGVFADTVIFDADGGTAGGGDANFTGDTVSGGNLNIGQGDTIVGAGVALNNVSGDLAFGTVNVTSNGTGLDITGSGSFNAAAGTGFRLATTSGTINSVNSSGVLFDPFTANVTLTSITSGGGVNGVLLDSIDGSFTVTGPVTVNGATGDGISLVNNGATINFQGTTTVNSPGGNGVGLSGNTGPVSFGAVNIDAPAGNGVDFSGSNSAVTFGTLGITNLGATTGLNLNGAALTGALNIGQLTITGAGAAGSIGIDLRGLTGAQTVNAGSLSGTISNVQIGVFIGNDTLADFTFGDGEDTTDTGSSISVIGGGYTVDASAGTVNTSSFNFDDVVFTGNANFPTSGTSYIFVSVDGADTSGGSAAEGTQANPYTAAEADLLTASGLNFVFLDGSYDFGSGTTLVAGGSFVLDSGQTAQALDFGNTITYGTTVPANVTGAFGATGGTITGSGASFTSNGGSSVFTLAGSNTISFLTVSGDALVDPTALIISNSSLGGYDNTAGITINGIAAGNVSAGNSVFSFTDMTGMVTISNSAMSISDGTLLGISGGSATYTVSAGTLPNSVTAGTLSASGAAVALDIQDTTGGSVSVSGLNSQGTGSALIADSNAATIDFSGLTAINHGTGTVFDIDTGSGGSTGAISFDATSAFSTGNTGTIFEIGAGSRDIDASLVNIVVTGATREVIDITGQSSGAISFGDVSYDGAGASGAGAIAASGMTGGTLSFGTVDIGSTTAFSTAAGTAVNLAGTGGSVSFTGLNINAQAGAGLVADGITLAIAGSGNDIATDGYTALGLSNLTVGNGGINFATVTAANGGVNDGIDIDTVTTSAGQGISIGSANLDGHTGVAIDINAITGAGGFTLISADIDLGAGGTGVEISGTNTGATVSIGNGVSNSISGLSIDGGATGISLSGASGTIEIASTDSADSVLTIGSSTMPTNAISTTVFSGTLNIGNATTQSQLSATGTAVTFDSSTFSSTVSLENAAVASSGGNGVTISGSAAGASVTVSDISVSANTIGVFVQNNDNAVTLTNIDINQAAFGIFGTDNNATGSLTVTGLTVDNTSDDAILLQNINASLSSVTIGADTAVAGDAIQYNHTTNTAHTLSISGLTIGSDGDTNDVGGRGIYINQTAGTGAVTVSLSGANEIHTTGAAIETETAATANILRLGVSGTTTAEGGSAGATIAITGDSISATQNSTVITGFSGVTVIGNGTAGGVLFDNVTFDSDVTSIGTTAASSDQVAFGALQIGQSAGARVSGNGLTFNNAIGDVDIATLNIFNDGGTGLSVDTKGVGTDFQLTGGGSGTIDTTNGAALFLDPLSTDLTFGTVSSTNSGTTGVTFDGVTGVGAGGTPNAVTIATLNITNAAGASVLIDTSSGAFSLGNATITGGGGAGIAIDGGSAAVTFGAGSSLTQTANAAAVSVSGGHTGSLTYSGTIGATAGTGLQFDNADGSQYNFNGAVTLNGGDAGVDIVNGSSASFTFSNLNITSPTGTAFNIDNSAIASLTFGGSITQNNAAAALVSNGSTGGIHNISATISASTGTANAVTIASTGTFNFSGDFGVTTTSGTGFAASGGATITLTGTNTSISTATGQILGWTWVSIGAGGVSFDTLSASGTTTNHSIDLNNVDGVGNTFSGGDVTIAGSAGAGIQISNGSDATFTFASATIDNAATPSAAISLSGANGAVTFTTIDIDGGTGGGVQIAGNTNAVTISGGSIGATTTTGGAAVVLNTGSGNVSIAAAITNGSGYAVDVHGRTAGTVTFSGDITDTGAGGISLASNTGGAVNFIGTTTINNATGTAISIASSGGSTVSFGAVAISNPTTTGIVIGTTGGATFGDVDIVNLPNNTRGVDLRTTSGAVTFNTLDISSASLTTGTRGIDLTGATNASNMVTTLSSTMDNLAIGVDLTNAAITGTFQYGDGSAPTASLIGNTTTAIVITGLGATGTYNFEDVAFTGSGTSNLSGGGGSVYWVAATPTGAQDGSSAADAGSIANAQLATADYIVLLDNAGAGQDVIDLSGGTVTLDVNQALLSFNTQDSFVLSGSPPANLGLTGISGGLTVTNPNTGSGAPLLTSSGAQTVTLSAGNVIDGAVISNTSASASSAILRATNVNGSFVVTNSTLTSPNNGYGIDITRTTAVTTTFEISNNSLTTAGASGAPAINYVNSNATGGDIVFGTISNNVIVTAANSDIFDASLQLNGHAVFSVVDNTFTDIGYGGLAVYVLGSSSLDLTIQGNTVSDGDNSAQDYVFLSTAGTSTTCIDIGGSTAGQKNTFNDTPTVDLTEGATATVRLPGYDGLGNVDAYLESRNNATLTTLLSGTPVGGSACTLP